MKNIIKFSLQKRIPGLLVVMFLSFLITACVGKESTNNNQTILPDSSALAFQAYTGNRAPTLLNKTNTLRFVELLFGTSDLDGLANRPDSRLVVPEKESSVILQIKSMTDLISQETRVSNIARRSVSEYRNCPNGGSLNVSGDLDDNDRGALLVEMYQCILEDNVTLDGEMSFLDTSEPNSGNESYLLSFTRLTAIINGERVIQTGSIQHYEGYSQQWFYKTVTNLYGSNSITGEEYLFENVTDLKGNYSGSLSGKIYLSNNGYITLSTTNDFQYNGPYAFPKEGALYLTGANNTHAQISPKLYLSGGVNVFNQTYTSGTDYYLSLDDDGDGLYESNVTQRIGEALLPLQDNQPPIGVITASTSRVIVPTYDDEYEHPEVRRGDTVRLFSSDSYDLENDDFDRKWTIESAPEGSISTLTHSRESNNNELTLDLPGKYKIGLTTTDPDGSGESRLTIVELDASNKPPVIDWFSIIEDPVTLDSPPQLIIMSFKVVDQDATEDDLHEGFSLETSLLSKPEASSTILEASYPYFYTNYAGRTLRGAIRFTPDKVGTYQFKITAEDAYGGISTRTITKEVL